MLDPQIAAAAWIQMAEDAMIILRSSEIEAGLDPAEGEDLELLQAGMALGIASACAYYKRNPDHVPTDD